MADEKYVVLIFPGMLDNKIIATGPECKQTGLKVVHVLVTADLSGFNFELASMGRQATN